MLNSNEENPYQGGELESPGLPQIMIQNLTEEEEKYDKSADKPRDEPFSKSSKRSSILETVKDTFTNLFKPDIVVQSSSPNFPQPDSIRLRID